MVEDFFGGKKIATADFPAEEAVSIGTGMQAGVLSAHDSDILESWWSYENVPLSLGIVGFYDLREIFLSPRGQDAYSFI